MSRRREHLFIILLFTAFFWAILLAVHEGGRKPAAISGGKSFLGEGRIVDSMALEEATADLRRLDFDSEALEWNGEPAPSDAEEETYFFSLDPGIDEWEGSVSSVYEDARLYLTEDEYWNDKDAAVEEGHAFTFVLVGKTSYIKGYIVFTGLPTISIDYKDGAIAAKESHSGTITVIDPANDSASSTNCLFHVRGNTSSFFEKKNYRISLYSGNGKKKDRNYLGMRKDDDWILNALYTDSTRAREKVCYSLWQEVNALEETPAASSSIVYVELFMNHEYMGLYGLMVPVDGKQMGLDTGDILYKVRTWMEEYTAEGDLTDYDGENEISNANGYNYAEIKYPNGPDSSFLWEPMQAWQDFVYDTQNPEALTEGSVNMDRSNILLHNLFCVLTHAGDNTWKNTFLAFYGDETGEYTLRETIWDLNYTFGDEFVLDYSVGNTVFNADSANSMAVKTDMDYGYAALLNADAGAAEETGALWKKWRQNGITAEHIKNMFTENEEILKRSGAGLREERRWPGSCGYSEDSFEKVLSWIDRRFHFLDEYYGLGVG